MISCYHFRFNIGSLDQLRERLVGHDKVLVFAGKLAREHCKLWCSTNPAWELKGHFLVHGQVKVPFAINELFGIHHHFFAAFLSYLHHFNRTIGTEVYLEERLLRLNVQLEVGRKHSFVCCIDSGDISHQVLVLAFQDLFDQ